MKRIICTADDYGVFPAINEAILDAARAGKINSVSVLANYDGDATYYSSVENLDTLVKQAPQTEIGAHLTITSGKPITGDKMDFACSEAGYFLSYTEMPNFKEGSQLKALREELCAQVERLKSVEGVTIRHLTNHHNSLTLFPHHFDVYMDVARLFKIPMRSTFVQPEGRQNFYMRFLNFKLSDDIDREGREEIRKFAKEIVKHFGDHCNGVTAPNILDSCHYGPVGVLPVRLGEFFLVGQKRKKLERVYQSYINSDKNSLELLFHLAKRDGFWLDKNKNLDYPGVDRTYFDSRVIEFKSLLGLDFKTWQNIEISGWDGL